MVAYSFNKQFIEPIRLGTKTQTIRANGKRRHAQMGEALQLYSGMRTAHCVRIIPDTVCFASGPVAIDFDDAMRITRIEVYGNPVTSLNAFARSDGFENLEDMGGFWEFTHGPMARFEGTLIEWQQPTRAIQQVVAA